MGKKVPKNSFWQAFEDLEDPRDEARNFQYPLTMVVGLGVLAIACGQKSFSGIAHFLRLQWSWFEHYFPGHSNAPSRSTFQRVFQGIHPKHFETCFLAWTSTLKVVKSADSTQVAIDGKTVRNSGTEHEHPLHLVSAFCTDHGLVLGQVATESKSNEIEAIPRLLEMLELKGTTVTVDAMGCQTKIAEAICEQGADYVLALKKNHKSLYEDVAYFFHDIEQGVSDDIDVYEENDKGHGRIETRTCYVKNDAKWLDGHERWRNLSAIARVDSIRIKKGKTTTHTRYFLVSKRITAQNLLAIVRNHWRIENQHHWVIDVDFGEDKACVRDKNQAHNIAIARRLAMNLIRAFPAFKGSLADVQRQIAFNFDARATLMNSIT